MVGRVRSDAAATAVPTRAVDGVQSSAGPVGASGARWMNVVVGVLLGALMLLPCVVTVALLAGRPWWPVDDMAAIDLQVRDVWSLHPPLTGLYSHTEFNHPGPLMFWLMSLISVPAGGAAWATRIGGAVLQGCALAWLAWLAWRRGLRTLLAAAAVTAATYLAAGPWLLREPWNPNVPVGFFILFLFLTAFVANGSFRLLIAMVFVGSFAVQTHVSNTVLVLAGLAWAIGCALVDARGRHRGPPQWRSTVVAAGAVGLLCWVGPAIDVVLHWPGNLTKIVVYFAGGEHTSVGLGSAARIMASEFHAVPPWAGGNEPTAPFTANVTGVSVWWLLVAIALLTGGTLAARATGSRNDRRLVALAALMFMVGIVSISRADEPVGFHFEWRSVIAVFVVVASLWSIAAFFAPRLPAALRRISSLLVLGGVVWASIALSVSIPSAQTQQALSPEMRLIARQLARAGLPHGTVLTRTTGELNRLIFHGVIDWLDRRGVDVRIDGPGSYLGYQRTIALGRARALWYVTESGSYVGIMLRIPGSHLIARTSPLAPAREAELSRLQARLWDQLRRAGRTDLIGYLDKPYVFFKVAQVEGVDPRAAARIGQLASEVARSGSCRCGVVSLPANPTYPILGVPIQG
jgi:hypothetical protein